MEGAKYTPMPMNALYVDQGDKFGSESQMFAKMVKVIFALGGGNQTTREVAITGLMLEKPVYLINVSNTPSVAEQTLENDLKIYKRGSEAVYHYNKSRENNLFDGRLTDVISNTNFFKKEMLNSFLAGRKLIGITSSLI